MTLHIKKGTTHNQLDKFGFTWNEHTRCYQKELTENEYIEIDGYDYSIRFKARMTTIHDYGLSVLLDLIEDDIIRRKIEAGY